MSGSTHLQPILILALSCTVVAGKVVQLPPKKNATTGQTVTFHCSFPLFRDKYKIVVRWWKGGEQEFLNSQHDPRRSFRVESKASAILRLQKVRFGDAGVYYCRVEGEFTGNGTGTQLDVSASPHPLTILPNFSANGSLTCLCKTSEFYPADVTIVWHKDGQKVTAGVKTSSEKNAKGLYEASSYLEEPQPPQSGTVFICEVYHSTLKVPTWVNYTVRFAENESNPTFPWWIYLCGAIALLLLIIALALCCKFCCCKKSKAHGNNIRMKQCVRCSEPITQNPKCKEQGVKKDNIQMLSQRNPGRVEKVNETAPKHKEHRKRDRDAMCA
ncbi:immunoglobulin lambda-1 light chain-like [Carcharodon carcharias]|uniref:immunoglobulin lambda-1 light chain-like n=1 Tax=Carcharodon carcharias TaxID=13397 RepID=UPI001B7F47A4|nr:immunoglobulin lambda-1 light chain-like [Carcharodon carcharias]